MKITLDEIEIKNLLSYRNAKFKVSKDYNVLIGKNSSGKSNFFKILRILRDNYLLVDPCYN